MRSLGRDEKLNQVLSEMVRRRNGYNEHMSEGRPVADAQNCDRRVTIRADSFTRSTATKELTRDGRASSC